MHKIHNIKVNQPANNGIGASFASLLEVISKTNQIEVGDTIHFDLSSVTFVYPTLILPLTLLVKELESMSCQLSFVYNSNCEGYLKTIAFPSGWNPKEKPDWKNLLAQHSNKSYIPILAIPSAASDQLFRDDTLTLLGIIIKNQIGLSGQLFTAVSYMMSEIFDNIVEHAGVENGWVMVQNYKHLNYIDICIADRGAGILKSYQNNNFTNILTHEQAINDSINGLSTKNYEGNRGYGIRTSRHMLVKGLEGSYFMFSGNAFYIWNKEIEQITCIDVQLFWKGTLVIFRIPKTFDRDFNFYNYIGD